jgi:hypothetical protein
MKAYGILTFNGLLKKPKLEAHTYKGEKLDVEHHDNIQYVEIDIKDML